MIIAKKMFGGRETGTRERQKTELSGQEDPDGMVLKLRYRRVHAADARVSHSSNLVLRK